MTRLWRLHIRPKGGDADSDASVAFCLERSIIGMGWPVPEENVTRSTDFEWYKEAAAREYPGNDLQSVEKFACEAAIGDLVWFRNKGYYYLAEMTGSWEYAYEEEVAKRADIVNYRSVRVVEVGFADAVPGNIIACFRPARTFQSINSLSMLSFSRKIFGLPTDNDFALDLYHFMTDADLENIIIMYLQVKGWYVLPATRTATTAHYEVVLVSRELGERAIVQVKSGNSGIDASQYGGKETAFLFAASGQYGPHIPPNVVVIDRSLLNNFMRKMPHLLPRAVSTWIQISGLPSDEVAQPS